MLLFSSECLDTFRRRLSTFMVSARPSDVARMSHRKLISIFHWVIKKVGRYPIDASSCNGASENRGRKPTRINQAFLFWSLMPLYIEVASMYDIRPNKR